MQCSLRRTAYGKYFALCLVLLPWHPLWAAQEGGNGDCWLNDCDAKSGAEGDGESGDFQVDFNQLGNYDTRQFNGFVSADLAYSLKEPMAGYGFTRDSPEVSKMQTTVNASYEQKVAGEWKLKISGNAFYDFYYQDQGRERFPAETLEAYESEVELRDTYIEGPLAEGVWFKFGKQTIAWGEADFSQVLSLANPVDIRELGRTDIKDALIPVAASKLVIDYADWVLDLVAIHEIRGNKIATQGAELDAYAAVRGPAVVIGPEQDPESSLENTEYLARLFRAFEKGDLSFVYADVYQNIASLEFGGIDQAGGFLTLIPEYDRFQTIGFSANYVVNEWLLKTEWAYKADITMARQDLFEQLGGGSLAAYSSKEKDLIEGVLGFTYAGPADLTASVESFWSRILNHEAFLASEEQSWTHTLMVTKDFMRDRAHTQLLLTYIPGPRDDSQIIRLGFDYDVSDDFMVTLGAIFYEASGPGAFFYPYEHSDNIFTRIKYSF